MRRKVFATVEVEFEMDDPGYDMTVPELRELVEEAVRQGLEGEGAAVALAAAVNHVAVRGWNP